MPLTKFQFRPGINREVTSYSNEGGWYDCDKIRFRMGFPEKIGGWLRSSTSTFLGTCRALHSWRGLDGSRFLGVGTHLKYYISEGGQYLDITPIRLTTSAGDATFSASANTLAADLDAVSTSLTLTDATGFPDAGLIKINNEQLRYAEVSGNVLGGLTRGVNGTTPAAHVSTDAVTCATLIVTETAHGALDSDFVTFSDAVTLGDQITATVLNQEYQITNIIDGNSYTIEARSVSSVESPGDPVFATASDSGSGGAGAIAAYQINTGLDTTLFGNGWGAGAWSRGGWGSGTDLTVQGATLRIWSHDNFGEDLIYGVRDGGIYYWDRTTGTTARGVELSTLPGANLTPTVAKQVLVSDRDRHVVVFGCDPEANIGTQDPLLIRFSSQESLTEWQSSPLTTAGELRLGSGSEIVTAVETRQQILVFTDVSLYAMQYLGPPFTFGVQMVSENVTIASPLAAIAIDDMVFWMGRSEFYIYNGSTTRLPCPVRDYVFDDMNTEQMEKITVGLNNENSEIWWFYPSLESEENDRYVVYNYLEQVWYYGNLARTCWLDRGVQNLPIAAGTDGYLYNHEIGFDDGSASPSVPIEAYVRSSPLDIADGEQFAFIRRMIPDVGFRNSTASGPSLSITTRVRNYSGGDYLRTTTSVINEDTEQVHLRLRGRQMSLLVESTDIGVTWRLGSMRYDIKPDGRR